MAWLQTLLIVMAAFLGMEFFAWFAHKYIMHGWGWSWHKSHHQRRSLRLKKTVLEKNDLYVLVFSCIVMGLFALGAALWRPLMTIASGITLYGVFYSLFHDGLVHKRWPMGWQPRRGYLKRLVQAHRMHHAVKTREGAVCFGFLWAPNVRKLRRQLREQKYRRSE